MQQRTSVVDGTRAPITAAARDSLTKATWNLEDRGREGLARRSAIARPEATLTRANNKRNATRPTMGSITAAGLSALVAG